MHSPRVEYERDGADVIVVARAEDDHGDTQVVRVRAIDGAVDAPRREARLALARETATELLR